MPGKAVKNHRLADIRLADEGNGGHGLCATGIVPAKVSVIVKNMATPLLYFVKINLPCRVRRRR
jgi:hypothetical protein